MSNTCSQRNGTDIKFFAFTATLQVMEAVVLIPNYLPTHRSWYVHC
uniref:Uncharacterized protein n=1 Tax=Rhizophora mucronata TaxID=61149 RepID=A0A2P2MZC4_RHIMU